MQVYQDINNIYPDTVQTIDADTGAVESNSFTKTFNTRKEAMLVMDTLDELGFEQNY